MIYLFDEFFINYLILIIFLLCRETVEKLENLLASAQSNKPSGVEVKLREEISNLEERIRQLQQSQPQQHASSDG